ncbi:hypothetical protein SSPIM334S_04449 [Streptomyces spiroverticillatus]|nr:hypothetical protein [Streptomyces finlayi]
MERYGRTRRRTMRQVAVIIGTLALLTACGSEKGDGPDRTAPPNIPSPPAISSPEPEPTASGPTPFRGRTDITFRPETTRPEGELERTAALMRKRASALGMKDVTITVRNGDVTVSAKNVTEERLTSLGAPAEVAFRPVQNLVPPSGKPCTPTRDRAPSRPMTACGSGADAGAQYLLGPVGVPGSDVTRATAENNQRIGVWQVSLTFNAAGAQRFGELSERLATQQQPMNQFAIVRDGEVLSAPTVAQRLSGGVAEISGSFTRESAQELAAQITSGSLPLRLRVSSTQRYS